MQFLTTTSEGYISLFFTLALMLVLLYFMIYRPQKKQEKKDAAMRSSLEIGDQVTKFAVGDKVDAKVTAFDKAKRQLSLSIKAREIAEEKEAVEQYGSSDSGASLGDILGAALKDRG